MKKTPKDQGESRKDEGVKGGKVVGMRTTPKDQGESRVPIGNSPEFMAELRKAEAGAKASTPVLILGETGTGKTVLAHHIHKLSGRKGFFPVNCATIDSSLASAELFGYEKGAFTGATRTTRGLFEQANGGTLFLDEVGELSPSDQAKLLGVLENGCIRRVGGKKNIPVKVRIIAATNRNVDDTSQSSPFRRDLFYRFSTVIRLPALRDRGDDILLMARGILRQHFQRTDRRVCLTREGEPAASNPPAEQGTKHRRVCLTREGKPEVPNPPAEQGTTHRRVCLTREGEPAAPNPPAEQGTTQRRVRLTRDGEAVLLRYPWPGNVRQLESTLERLIAQGGSKIDAARLERELDMPQGGDMPADLPTRVMEVLPQYPTKTRLMTGLRISRSRALGVLSELKAEGLIDQLGIGRGTYYRRSASPGDGDVEPARSTLTGPKRRDRRRARARLQSGEVAFEPQESIPLVETTHRKSPLLEPVESQPQSHAQLSLKELRALELFQSHKRILRKDIEALGIPRRSASRLLEHLEEKALIKCLGSGRYQFYEAL